MAIRVWDPFTALARLDEEFDELMRRTWGERSSGFAGNPVATAYVPAIDLHTEGSDVVIRLELPGVDVGKDVDIEVAEGRLTISGERREESSNAESGGRMLVSELRYGAFRRDFALPEGVTADDVSASYDRGLLEVRVRGVAKPIEKPRKVQINSGDAKGRSAKVIDSK